MRRYYITDRRQFGSISELLDCIFRNDRDGVDFIQIREKDLEAKPLMALVESALKICQNAEVLVNSRVDIALAAGAHGVHLPSYSIPPAVLRRISPAGFRIGVSCHSVEEVRVAEAEGADYAILAPIFAPLSKADQRAPLGLQPLREAAGNVRLPVLALGGITHENAPACLEAGAAGVAGITLFQRHD